MTLEELLIGLFVIALILLAAFGLLLILWYATGNMYCKYCIRKKTNKLQWRCEEVYKSKEKRLNNETDYYLCRLSYRILPSELNKFVRIFGNNYWIWPFDNIELKFKSQDEFEKYIEHFKTYDDLKKWIDKENDILWYEP